MSFCGRKKSVSLRCAMNDVLPARAEVWANISACGVMVAIATIYSFTFDRDDGYAPASILVSE